MEVMYFKGREKRNEQLVVRALHYITLHYITSLRLAWKNFLRAIQNAMHFESLFLCERIAQ